MRHLWEVDHPYYMNEGNYFRTGDHVEYNNLDTFLEDWGHDKLDIEYNRIHRFDAYDYKERNLREGEFEVTFYRVIQRKAFCMSQSVIVPKERENEVIEYLQPFYEQERKIWEPFTESHNATPTQHETALEAEKGNETDS